MGQSVVMRDLKLQEFDIKRWPTEQKALVFYKKYIYDVILGKDFLTKTSKDIQYSKKPRNGSNMYFQCSNHICLAIKNI